MICIIYGFHIVSAGRLILCVQSFGPKKLFSLRLNSLTKTELVTCCASEHVFQLSEFLPMMTGTLHKPRHATLDCSDRGIKKQNTWVWSWLEICLSFFCAVTSSPHTHPYDKHLWCNVVYRPLEGRWHVFLCLLHDTNRGEQRFCL